MFEWLFKVWWLTTPVRPGKTGAIIMLSIFGLIGLYGLVSDIKSGISNIAASRPAWLNTSDPFLIELMSRAASLANNTQASESKRVEKKRVEWRPIRNLIASTPFRRLSAAKRLDIANDDYYIAFISIRCSSCDREALKLNQKDKLDRIIAFAVAPQESVEKWQKQLGLNYQVRSLSQQDFDDLGGVVLLPTLIHLRNGVAVGASETADAVD